MTPSTGLPHVMAPVAAWHRRWLLWSRLVCAGAGLAGLAGGSAVWAGTATNSVSANTTVTSACVVSGTTLNFGNAINPVGVGPVDATSTITVQCTADTTFSVALNAGFNTGNGSNFAGRVLKSGSNTLGYQLYLNTGRTSIWGDGTAGSAVYSSTGTGNAMGLTIYGRLPSLTGVPPGTYTDTVTMTVTY